MIGTVENEIDFATILGQSLEALIFNKVKTTGFVRCSDRDDLVVAYWSIIFDYCKGILSLLHHKFHHSAFALLRPVTEALVRECVSAKGSDEQVLKIRKGQYNVSYEKDGARIDKEMGTAPLLEKYLKDARPLLHSFTHSGTAQLWRSFDGSGLGSNFTNAEIKGLVRNCASAAFLTTVAVALHFGFHQEIEIANHVWVEYGT